MMILWLEGKNHPLLQKLGQSDWENHHPMVNKKENHFAIMT